MQWYEIGIQIIALGLIIIPGIVLIERRLTRVETKLEILYQMIIKKWESLSWQIDD